VKLLPWLGNLFFGPKRRVQIAIDANSEALRRFEKKMARLEDDWHAEQKALNGNGKHARPARRPK
jgi:hypothetical protein